MNSFDRIVTFLFTDIEGSTALWESCPDLLPNVLTRHDELLQGIISSNNGHMFKSVGDGVYSAFSQPESALDAAVAIQRAVELTDWNLPSPLRLRIALHTGEASMRMDDYFGLSLTRAARILEIGHGGQILCSDSTEQALRENLPVDVKIAVLGRVRLKSLQRHESVFQINAEGLRHEFPVLRSLEAYRHNLPIQLTSFVGRDMELSSIRNAVRSSKLVTITGSGGSGKTRLALQAAADLLDEFDRGVWMVELASIADPEVVLSAIAKVLGVREEPGIDLVESIIRSYHSGRMLILLDNCEHVIDRVAAIAHRITKSSQNITVLSTSRERLHISGEWLVRLDAMPLLKKPGRVSLSDLLANDCARLFIERATANNPALQLTDLNAACVAKICHSLDGIPLAIELAAARTGLLSLEQLELRLSDRFRLLSGGSRTAVARQRTLEAMIDWSYDLLTEAERILLVRLTVFSGGWTLDAAEHICSGNGLDSFQVLDLLDALVNKSLVTVDDHGSIRYRLLESLRSYGINKRNEQDFHELMIRHGRWYLERIKDFKRSDLGVNRPRLLGEMDYDIGNVRSAIEFTKTHDPVLSLDISYRMYSYWYSRGYLSEGATSIAAALDRVASLSEPVLNEEYVLSIRSKALGNLAVLEFSLGDLDSADRSIRNAMELCEQIGDDQGMAANHNNLAMIAAARGDSLLADELNRKALSYYESVNALPQIAACYAGLGLNAMSRGDIAQSEEYYIRSMGLFEKSGDQSGMVAINCNLAEINFRKDDFQKAIDIATDGLQSAVKIGDRAHQLILLEILGASEVALGNYEHGLARLAAAEAARIEHRNPRYVRWNECYQKTVKNASDTIHKDLFTQLWEAGSLITVDVAISLGL